MRCLLAALLICLTIAHAAAAGAWLQDKDQAFIAASSTLRKNDVGFHFESKLYVEYGLSDRITIGLDANENTGTAGHALLFARLPLGDPTRRTRFAVELGVGGHHRNGDWSGMYKAALAAGRGFEHRWGDGWMGLDAAVERRLGAPNLIYKLDAVIGLSSGRRFRPMLKLETAKTKGNALAWTLGPSLMIDGKKKSTWVIGLERKSAGQISTGFKLGFWRRF